MSARYPVLLPAIVINATNKGIRVTENATTGVGNIVEGTYFLRGDGASDDLCVAIKTAIEAATASTNTYTVEIVQRVITPSSSTAAIRIARATGADTFALLFSHATSTFDEALIGFANSDTALNASNKNSTLSPTGLWVSPEVYRELEIEHEYAGGGSRAQSGRVRYVRRGGPYDVRRWSMEMVDYRRTWEADNASDPGATFSYFLELWGTGRFEFHGPDISAGSVLADTTSSTLLGTFQIDPGDLDVFAPTRGEPGIALYDWTMRLMGYVA